MKGRVPVFVGIDCADQISPVVVLDADGRELGGRRRPSESDGLIAYAERFGPIGGVALEASCGAATLADELIQRLGWPVQLAHPGFVRRMKRNPDKTDYSDTRAGGSAASGPPAAGVGGAVGPGMDLGAGELVGRRGCR